MENIGETKGSRAHDRVRFEMPLLMGLGWGLVLLLAGLFFFSCAREEETPSLRLAIRSAEPREITQGVEVTVSGEGFGTDEEAITLTLVPEGETTGEEVVVEHRIITGTTLVFSVPELPAGEYDLSLSVDGASDHLPAHFSYVRLSFDDFFPQFINVGSSAATITLTGSGFKTPQGGLEVWLDETLLSTVSITSSKIVVRLPGDTPVGRYALRVVVRGTGEELSVANGKELVVRDPSAINSQLEHLLVDRESPVELGRMNIRDLRSILNLVASVLDVPTHAEYCERDIVFYKIKYHTRHKGVPLIASGVIAVPIKKEDMPPAYPLYLEMNSSIVRNEDAPSLAFMQDNGRLINNPSLVLLADGEESTNKIHVLASLSIASAGYVAVFPDGIGFGVSRWDAFHPYLHEASSAQAAADVVLAVREFTEIYLASYGETTNVRVSGSLTLVGLSGGAHAAVAAHRRIETDLAAAFSSVTSHVVGGPYQLVDVVKSVAGREEYPAPYFLPYLYLAYKDIYGGADYRLADVFKQPYVSRLPDLFSDARNATGAEINSELTSRLPDLLQDAFRTGFPAGEARWHYLTEALAANDLSRGTWRPSGALHFYHSTADELVDYQLAKDFSDLLIQRGGQNIFFQDVPGAPAHTRSGIISLAAILRNLASQGGESSF